MALAHNILIRGLNSIYRQAPYVKPEEQKDFVGYAQNFVNVLSVHHASEEESFFPDVEKMSGEAGVMEKNVEQHHEFHDGLHELQDYLGKVADGVKTYDGQYLVKVIDGFGPSLSQHLAEEIQCLLELKRYGPDKMKGLAKALEAEGQSNLVGPSFVEQG
jgi:hemerythrin-like domain-containing protein